MATRLNQIIAVEKTVKTEAAQRLTKIYQTLQKLPLLTGLARTYQPKDEDGEQLPGESTRVQVTVDEALADITATMTRLFDVTAAKDWTNTKARADIVVDDTILLPAVPITYLLFLEKRLVDLATVIRKLPTLDPAETWHRDDASDAWRTDKVQTTRTKKVPRNHVKAPATDKHPAQVDVYMEDVVVGFWSTVKFSGALPAARVNELLGRVTVLAEAVKHAREEANVTHVDDPKPGSAILGYLLR